MKFFPQLTEVARAQARVRAAREELGQPMTSLFARSDRHPLSTVGIAAGVGFALGSLNLHPLRVPGVGPLLGGGLADAAALATRWLVEQGLEGFGQAKHRSDDADDVGDMEDTNGAESETAPTARSRARADVVTP